MINLRIEDIAPGNPAISFIARRIQDDNYRGVISSQHNRYTLEQITIILSTLNGYAPNHSLLRIRTTDLSKRPQNLPEELDYARMCDEIKSKVGIGTPDALRKNLFVDFHRMGLIDRYSKEKILTDPYKQTSIFYVSLTELGTQLISASPQEQHFIYSRAVNNFLPGYIDILIELLRSEDPAINQITSKEFMYFVSAVNSGTSFTITLAECRDFLIHYKSLSPIQKRTIDAELQEKLDPSKFSGDKLDKRDFHNWKNKADQVFLVLSQTVYFDKNTNGDLVLSQTKDLYGTGTKLKRSYNQKQQYFKNHTVGKRKGFELHHVVALATSKSLADFKALDFWKNMLYIDGKKHSELSQALNRHVYLNADNDGFLLTKYPLGTSNNDEIKLIYDDNVVYNPTKQSVLLKYNKSLINGL